MTLPAWAAPSVVLGLLAVATVMDLRRRTVANWLTLGGIGAGLGATAIAGPAALGASWLGLAVGGLLLLPFVRRGGFGGADALLLALVGAWLGWPLVLWAAWWTALVGAGLALLARRRGQRTFSYVPAIALGTALALVLRQ